MSFRTTLKKNLYLTALLAIMLAAAACSLQPSQTDELLAPTPTNSQVISTETPTAPAAPEGAISVEYDGVSFWFSPDLAKSWTVEFVPQGPGTSTSAGPTDYTDPEHLIFSLDYYISTTENAAPLLQPKIYIYPAVEMSAQNPIASTQIIELQNWLNTPPDDPMDQTINIPFLPLFNAAQAFHTQLKSVDFQNGTGIRFLTMYAQGPVPVNNNEIFYTYQGLTNDGATYVAVTMPVSHPSLEADPGNVFMDDPINYLNGVAEQLDRQASNTFTPDLSVLDALIETLSIKP